MMSDSGTTTHPDSGIADSAPPSDSGQADSGQADSGASDTGSDACVSNCAPGACEAQNGAHCWYVDGAVSGTSHDGKTWATAWSNVTAISGIGPGDFVYISGGPTGSSRSYAVSSWAPSGGSATNIITYKIGQDAGHNGTAVFTGSGTWISGGLINLTISGDAGDGAMHFSIAGGSSTSGTSPYASAIHNYGQGGIVNSRVSYVNFGHIGQAIFANPAGPNAEVDHTYSYINNMQADANSTWFGPVTGNGGYDTGLRYHDNTTYVPGAGPSSGIGEDGIDAGGDGLSIYNNTVSAYYTSAYTGPQHMDGYQGFNGGNYVRISGNRITGFPDIGIYLENTGAFGNATWNHVRIDNNVVVCPNCGVAEIAVECEGGGTQTFDDIIVANNLVQGGGIQGISWGVGSGTTPVYNNDHMFNNISIGPNPYFYLDAMTQGTNSVSNNVTLTDSQAAASFRSYTPQSATNDYHLTAAASLLIGQGVNESASFTTDFDGKLRPATGAWDVGPYKYGP
jgi:hypothetical protein